MAMSMGPPMLPGFSLRVQLFSPHAHALNDKPLRCFRVVTSPDATVRQFCEEASRIHEINYGEPIAIKKCQDDQEFDITQSEILGTLFANAATIRLIQAPATTGLRDSVPPTSALRFDPTKHLGRKREREGSARPNGSPPSSIWRPNKRQRVSNLDPDQPLPSRERDLDIGGKINEEEPRHEMIPDSQQEAASKGNNGNSRHVRDDVPRISETPSPLPELPDFVHFDYGSADRQGQKSNVPNTDDPLMSQASIPSPFGPASMRAQNPAKSKSAGYHIQKATERGASVSTAATSPLSGDQQAPMLNGTRHANNRRISDPAPEDRRINGKPNSRSPNEDSIYENVPSDSEGSAILRRTKERLKGKNGSPSGLPGLDWAKKFNTPPNGSRTSRSQERTTTNGELPLTPNSKEREERQRQNQDADATRKARIAAAEAAEQRKREADETRAAEDRERMRKLREKSERDAQQKRNEVIAKATRLEEERLERMRKLDEEREAEENYREQKRIQEGAERNELMGRERRSKAAKERQEGASFERDNQARIEKIQQEAERLQREKANADEAERIIEEEAKRRAKETALAMKEMRKSMEESKASTPDRSKAPIRPQSSTPFIPSGRKSALKAPSSQAAKSSSPVLARTNGSKPDIEPPNAAKRRVSFDLKEPLKQTPIRTPILPPSRASASKPASKSLPPPKAMTSNPPTLAKKELSPKPSVNGLAKKSTTPIPLPPTKRSSISPAIKSILPVAQSTSQNREILNGSTKPKESAQSAAPVQVTISSDESEDEDEEDDDDDDDEEDLDGATRVDPVRALNTSLRSLVKSKPDSKPKSLNQEEDEEDEEDEDEDEDEDVEMQDIQSNRSSSRSPIMFNSHATPGKSEHAEPAVSASSTSDESEDEDDSAGEEESADGEVEASEEEEEKELEDKTITTLVSQSSPPSLPVTKPIANMLPGEKPSQPSSTAVKSTPIPPPPSTVATPKFSFGASLSSLNATKPILSSSVSKANGKSQPLILADNDEESEEESEEESDSSSESDDEQDRSHSLPKPRQIQPLTAESDDDLDSDSESSSDKENQDEKEIAQNVLAAHIVKMTSDSQTGTQSYDIPSPNIAKGSQPSKSIGGGKKSNGGSGKNYITGYSFSQPK